VAGITQAQTSGGITPQMLQQMEKQQAQQPMSRGLFNAIAQNNIDDLAKNFQNQGDIDTHFSIETPKQSIHDQKSSGRCWMFSGLNVLRSNFAKQHEDTLAVEFSHDYLFFYDQLEKANLMLQGVIDHASKPMDDTRVQFFFHHPINDGGTFCGVSDLAYKYGLVPKGVQPETYSADNTSRMARIISSKLREYGLELREMVASKTSSKAVQARKTEMLSDIYRMLCITLGEPVKEFTWAPRDEKGRYKSEPRKYTPLDFYKEWCTDAGDLNKDYVMLARIKGAGEQRIMFRHILPNVAHIILIQFSRMHLQEIRSLRFSHERVNGICETCIKKYRKTQQHRRYRHENTGRSRDQLICFDVIDYHSSFHTFHLHFALPVFLHPLTGTMLPRPLRAKLPRP